MAHIMSMSECEKANPNCEHQIDKCPFPACSDNFCLECDHHCPCCTGCNNDLCNQCPEEDCDNRTVAYDANSISNEE